MAARDRDDGGLLDEWADEAPLLAGLAAASVQGRVALRLRAGARVRRAAPRDSGRATHAITGLTFMPASSYSLISGTA
jgi:hypothetical protein